MSSSWAGYSSIGRWLRATNSTGTATRLRTSSSTSTSSAVVPAWAAEPTPEWFTPEIAAARWEGREPGT